LLTIAELGEPAVHRLARRGELLLDIHPFVARVLSPHASVARDLVVVYADFQVIPPDRFADFHVAVRPEPGLRRWFRPLIRFHFDGVPAFTPLQADHATVSLEWGLNWCVSTHSHQYLVIHAAVVERHGLALILPAPPGSGKSTLCAALVQRGWRLLSDELALYDASSGVVYGMSRPINLKNESINVIADFAPGAAMTVPVRNTSKGTVALMRPPTSSVHRAREAAMPRWVVLPRYAAGAPTNLVPHSRARAFMLLAEQSFNYDVLGRGGFDALAGLVDRCECFEFTYSQLDEAICCFDQLAASGVAAFADAAAHTPAAPSG
jgi:HprK-related kinase A